MTPEKKVLKIDWPVSFVISGVNILQRKNPQKRIAVLKAAQEHFSEKSFHDVKLEEIAESAGVGKGTIYTYFKSKDELFVRCLLHDIPDFEKKTEDIIAAEKDFRTSLKELISVQFEFVKLKGPMAKQVMALGPQLKISDSQFKELSDLFQRSIKRLASFFQKGIQSGILNNTLSAGQMAIMFQGIFDLNVAFSYFKEPEMEQETAFNCLMRIFGNSGEQIS